MNANDNDAKVLGSFVCVQECLCVCELAAAAIATWQSRADKEQSSSAWCVYDQVSVRVCAIFTGVRVQVH